MLIELLVATGMVLLTVLVHGWGLSLLGRVLHAEATDEAERRLTWRSIRALGFTVGMVIGLFVLHGFEIWLYAALYHGLGAIPDVRLAVYYSTITYGAIGFSDAEMADQWRLLGAIEGINGILLIGWTTAFFVTVMGRFERPARRP